MSEMFQKDISSPLNNRPLTTLKRMLIHPKDKILEDMKTGVVYQIQCGTCKKTYIGQTGRSLKHRVKEHRRALISHNANFSAVAEHAMRENHDITWHEASVIDGNDKWIQRCHLEGWYIRLMKSAMKGFLPSDYDYWLGTGKAHQIAMSIRLLSNVYFLFIFYNI